MRVPEMRGVIERRLLVNYRVDVDVAASMLPAPFEPQLVNGYAVAGICLIRLGHMRPRAVPRQLGLTSENAAHRVAVQWWQHGQPRTGVYIPRRDSASVVNAAVGGRLFPGHHHRSDFSVRETDSSLAVAFVARDRSVSVDVDIDVADSFPGSVLFQSLEDASRFFKSGSAGFSPTRRADDVDGLELHASTWKIEPAIIRRARSSMFDDQSLFPSGSITFDSVFVMRNIEVEWHGLGSLRSDAPVGSPLLGATAGTASAA